MIEYGMLPHTQMQKTHWNINLVFILNDNATHTRPWVVVANGGGDGSVTVSTLLAVCLSFLFSHFISFHSICECAQQWVVVLLSLHRNPLHSVSLHHSRLLLCYLFQPLNGSTRFTVYMCMHTWHFEVCVLLFLCPCLPACLAACLRMCIGVYRIRLLKTC